MSFSKNILELQLSRIEAFEICLSHLADQGVSLATGTRSRSFCVSWWITRDEFDEFNSSICWRNMKEMPNARNMV